MGEFMDTDIISYETLIATQDSAEWVMYGAIAAWVAAIGSIATLAYAAMALKTWKQQEKTKIRKEFKRSLLALDYAIHMMPDNWNSQIAISMKIRATSFAVSGNSEIAFNLSELKKCWHDAISAWVMCEGLLIKTSLTKSWAELSEIYGRYIQGYVGKKEILDKLAEMHSVKFIFD
jgi:hypothetical protein